MTTKTEQLRPCPFCGSDAKESDQAKAIYCSACFAGTSTYMDVRYAAEHWNHRPIEDQLLTQLAATKEKLARAERVIKSFEDASCVCGGQWDEFYHNDECTKFSEAFKAYREVGSE